MNRPASRRLSSLALAALLAAMLGGCVSPFSDHASDVHDAWAEKAHNAHRKWDRYVLGLDWDDPNHEWHDESYATGPMHR
ncbi:MAG: hypothetical protein FJ296_06590 [Planctomycetes bacterium]|nr:hypothetical protein [Planctomycetota bacterium]